jgi:hypothetical protein
MKIDGHEHIEIETWDVQIGDVVVWTNKHGQHTNRVIETDLDHPTNSSVFLERHAHDHGDPIRVSLIGIKKCWRRQI